MAVKTENAFPVAAVSVDIVGTDIGSYVNAAQQVVQRRLSLPPGYRLAWSGQFEFMARVRSRLLVVVPVTLALIFLLLYLNFRGVAESLIVMASLPFGVVGGVWSLWLLGYNTSVTVWVGFIALAGVAAETGVIMLMYLDEAYHRRLAAGEMRSAADLLAAVHDGAVERLRPKIMTVVAIMAGLAPILWGSGAGADVMKRIAAPMVGGMVSSTVLTLVVIPAVYLLWRGRQSHRRTNAEAWSGGGSTRSGARPRTRPKLNPCPPGCKVCLNPPLPSFMMGLLHETPRQDGLSPQQPWIIANEVLRKFCSRCCAEPLISQPRDPAPRFDQARSQQDTQGSCEPRQYSSQGRSNAKSHHFN